MALFSFRRLDIDPLAVSMSGVKLGERLLQVGVDDAALAGLLASKTGLSGSAAHAVSTDAEAVRVNRGAKKAGVLVEVRVTPLDQLPYEAASFDVVVVHSAAGQLASADAAARLGGAARPAARGASRGATGRDRAGSLPRACRRCSGEPPRPREPTRGPAARWRRFARRASGRSANWGTVKA